MKQILLYYLIHKRFLLALIALTISVNVTASDHGEGHIGDFYTFKRGNNLVLVMTVKADLPFDISNFKFSSDYTYNFFIDNDSKVSSTNPSNRYAFGLQVVDPSEISEDVSISISFNGEGDYQLSTKGLKSLEIKVWTGVRDDPFIREGVRELNIPAIVIELPLQYVLNDSDQSTILSWATTTSAEGNKQHDHCGHPYRSQTNRKLNTLHPKNHKLSWRIPNELNTLWQAPDVLVFNTTQVASYPNGRDLTDDVVGILPEYIVKRPSLRAVKNDVPFLEHFPYLAEPHIYKVGKLPGPHTKDIYNAPLAVFDLASIGLPGRKARIRYWIMNPGGIIGHHWHDARPAFVYLTEGTVIETKCTDAPDRNRSGDCNGDITVDTLTGPLQVREPEGIQHWWLNHTTNMVRMVAIDLPPPDPQMSDTPLDYTQIDFSPITTPTNTQGVIVENLGAHDLFEQFPNIETVKGYQLRCRLITIPPGKESDLEVTGPNSPKPTFAYFLSGDAWEERNDRRETIRRAGDFSIITKEADCYWQNKTSEEVTILVFDFLNGN